MAKRKTVRKIRAKKAPSTKVKTAVQEALEVTWVLKGHLKNLQLSYIRVGKLLSEVRDKKMYETLGHKDIDSYAAARLRLGRSSLYRYLQVYDWVLGHHKEWLDPKPKGFIPELNDAAGLMWIEETLTRKDLDAPMKKSLEGLQKKALDGTLDEGDLEKVRRQAHSKEQGLKSFLSKVRNLRMRGSQLASMPPEAIKTLDATIEIIQNALSQNRAS